MKLKIGQTLKTKDLVACFGNDVNKANYKRVKKISNTIKRALLFRASQLYNIEDLSGGNYIIHEVYKEKRELHKKNIRQVNRKSRKYEHPQYNIDMDDDKTKGIYQIKLGDDIYIGSTSQTFRKRFCSYKTGHSSRTTGYQLFLKGGIYSIVEKADQFSTLEEIRALEQKHIDKFRNNKNLNLVNAINVRLDNEKISNKKIANIKIKHKDLEKALELLKNNGISIEY